MKVIRMFYFLSLSSCTFFYTVPNNTNYICQSNNGLTVSTLPTDWLVLQQTNPVVSVVNIVHPPVLNYNYILQSQFCLNNFMTPNPVVFVKPSFIQRVSTTQDSLNIIPFASCEQTSHNQDQRTSPSTLNQHILPTLTFSEYIQKMEKIITKELLGHSKTNTRSKELLTIIINQFNGDQILTTGFVIYFSFFLNGFKDYNNTSSSSHSLFTCNLECYGISDLEQATYDWSLEDIKFKTKEECFFKLTTLAKKYMIYNFDFVKEEEYFKFGEYVNECLRILYDN